MFDLSDVRFVRRIVVGSNDPGQMTSDAQIEEARALLNRCLGEAPRGHILATEKSFAVLQVGEHQVVLQWICYHVGFARKPAWMPD